MDGSFRRASFAPRAISHRLRRWRRWKPTAAAGSHGRSSLPCSKPPARMPSSSWLPTRTTGRRSSIAGSVSNQSASSPDSFVCPMADDQALSEAWEAVARDWVEWARKPGHDSYWRFHKEPFFALLPPPGRLTIDIGCGEGRVARDLKALGHNVVAVDVSPTMVEYAKTADPSMKVLVADAAHLPFDDGAADLAVAFMSLHDVDDMPGAIHEAGRVVERGGAFCLSIVHPINSAGRFESLEADARFFI